ncbi:MAG: hypothetical protein UV61_C0005G0055 [Candidatus Gottesmanbacteria bacterium GW2011_GWB1_43_11]|uniref:Pilus assembly protein, PilO n=1 Tax=Candidatus Gottesmanbacteria bacterium GW2011_GWB1_43_11 TaxID=1618446 RepID=A0A0G1CNA5_9BACT|nr:MAG: hypothetical protein UV04_C0008G0013 [Candidatus Gottesmanbacteria bacterium GW2011_GWA2_42_16]KKS55946.1 MAG: hypothetical protein UV17_C0005G0055 [Candidatus Gottesmanbacteria bacterium GW2011_GWA1_42_26]KKS81758.1 MAG: hypothetical protein UV55_C0009G0034 [Candidatus Gottesmanbacteria bacterium GW2011_GWC1_43_10]KKS87034.1 MAG: hypothetical protein UV61_C0005G0055 [Candidatus Gottesmanbacteria bacterium GW2011_GWB1_43_11]OGG07563.1 MAG: hypothetical protein A2699_04860 [Candidatus Go
MPNTKPKTVRANPVLLWGLIFAVMILVNALFIFFALNETKTVKLLKTELVSLEQDGRIIASAQEINDKYRKEIDLISNVFPNEESLPVFVQSLETQIRNTADEYTIKFNSITPLTEQDKLFLPLTITLETDLTRLIKFLDALEHLSYMTHVSRISAKVPDGYTTKGEYNIGVKIYVQKPFSAK